MQISLSSDNYEIVAHGQVFLFGKEKDLTVKIASDHVFSFSLVLQFLEDASEEMKVEPSTIGERGPKRAVHAVL